MNYFLIAGEASGDLHGANLIKALKKIDPSALCYCYGGDLMQKEGGILLKHYREMAFMGFLSVLLHLPQLLRNIVHCKAELKRKKPDCVILVDYAGFNLRMAKYVKKELHLPVFYYIAPKVWAWDEGRIRSIQAYVDRVFCILPFEEKYFMDKGCRATYVGNPVVDAVEEYKRENECNLSLFRKEYNLKEESPLLALLCGSRKTEIRANLPLMLEATEHLSHFQRVIAVAPGLKRDFYLPFVKDRDVYLLEGETYKLLQHATAAIVTSGTATLETALFDVPQVCCYAVRGGKVVYNCFKKMLHVRFISLVNLIADKAVILELVSYLLNVESLKMEIHKLLFKPAYTDEMKVQYALLREKLGGEGASERTAEIIVKELSKRK